MQRALAGVTKRGMTEVVGKTGGFDQVGVDAHLGVAGFAEPMNDGTSDLRNFKAVGEPGAIKVVFADEEGVEHLGFALQTAQRGAVKNAVAVNLERAAVFGVGDVSRLKRGEIGGSVKGGLAGAGVGTGRHATQSWRCFWRLARGE